MLKFINRKIETEVKNDINLLNSKINFSALESFTILLQKLADEHKKFTKEMSDEK